MLFVTVYKQLGLFTDRKTITYNDKSEDAESIHCRLSLVYTMTMKGYIASSDLTSHWRELVRS